MFAVTSKGAEGRQTWTPLPSVLVHSGFSPATFVLRERPTTTTTPLLRNTCSIMAIQQGLHPRMFRPYQAAHAAHLQRNLGILSLSAHSHQHSLYPICIMREAAVSVASLQTTAV